tara:strand:- start:626 stop:1126 length:501 start_codon:yes stop_codon:yes gene_type:complete
MVDNHVMATPISQLLKKEEPKVKENFLPFNQTIKNVPEKQASLENHLNFLEGGSHKIDFPERINNRIFGNSYANKPVIKKLPKPDIRKEIVKPVKKKRKSFFQKITDLLLIISIYVIISQRRLSYLIKYYFPFFRKNASSIPILSLKGFLFGLIYMAIKKFISSDY